IARLRCGACNVFPDPGTRPGLMVSNSQLPSSAVAIRPKPNHAASLVFSRISSGWLYLPSASACQISITASLTGVPSPSMTRQVSQTRSPLACGEAMHLTERASVIPKWKYGPAVCEGVGIRSMSSLERRGVAPAQDDVKTEAQRPLRLRRLQIKPGD